MKSAAASLPQRAGNRFRARAVSSAVVALIALAPFPLSAQQAVWKPVTPTQPSGEQLYQELRQAQRDGSGKLLFSRLRQAARSLEWSQAETRAFEGNLRPIGSPTAERPLYLVRSLKGDIYVLSMPIPGETIPPQYNGLAQKAQHRLLFEVRTLTREVDGRLYTFAQLVQSPKRPLLDRLFRIAIIALLFFVMIGMGLTLRIKDFALVLIKPRGMLVGPILQFGLLPALAAGLATLAGYPEAYPFMFVGFVLIASSPGGVTSNLMTYWGKGDLALSVSMTALSTVLSLILTPALILLYTTQLPDIQIPKGTVAAQILVLVIIPLAVGMAVRNRFEAFAKRAEGFFSGLGVFALLFLIVTGVLSNLDKLADFDRYGPKFYLIILTLSLTSMVCSVGIAKFLFRVDNFQTRAIALETGLQNSALAMTIALLLQDRVGDFHSSMFAVAGLYGLCMYVSGAFMIFAFPKVLPVDRHLHVQDARKSG